MELIITENASSVHKLRPSIPAFHKPRLYTVSVKKIVEFSLMHSP